RHLNYCPIPLTNGSIINVEGFEGRNVSFQCKHKIASKSNKYFCKDPCKGEGDILVTVEPGRRAESGRITLVDSGDGSFTVTFSHLQLSDSQKYWCAVDRPGFDTFTEVQLRTGFDTYAEIHLTFCTILPTHTAYVSVLLLLPLLPHNSYEKYLFDFREINKNVLQLKFYYK
uniref:Immunoglobulin V-set domain-containing protein n=1 Tax=Oreochromis niloticus TaxID=8128 RepID=A0A669C4R1_ORENI